jgi:hypothetical protein
MNTIQNRTAGNIHPFVSACAASCRKIMAKLENARQALFEEFRRQIHAPEQMLYLALNEAEALARQTEFPLLVFPTLAREKAEAVSAWQRRQEFVRGHSFERLAA